MSKLSDIEHVLKNQSGRPPLDQWQPALSGDIDIQILVDGRWLHEGDEIRRHALVRLFASILRRESDGEYYLVTPVEKWRIQVEDLPLLITDFEALDTESHKRKFVVKTNVDTWFELSQKHPLIVTQDSQQQPSPRVILDYGLEARVNRACFYRLVEFGQEKNGDLLLQTTAGEFTLGKLE